MPRQRSLKPSYCLHKATGRAYVTLDGKPVYLGKHGTQASRDAYDRVIGEWIARGRQSAPPADAEQPDAGATVAMVVDAFWQHAKVYYRGRDGKTSAEALLYKQVLRLLNRMYGASPAAKFGPLALKAIQETVIKPHKEKRPRLEPDPETGEDRKVMKEVEVPGWCRTHANRQMSRIKMIFKWATEHEMIPPSVYQALVTVAGLRKGKTDARESEPVRAVGQDDVGKVTPLLPPPVKAMVELEAVTGMRPGEARIMRTGDIDRSNAQLWVYTPRYHKTEHHGADHLRRIYLGAKAREILAQFLKLDPDAFIFRPADADAWVREQKRLNRKTPLTPSQRARAASAARRARKLRDHYTKDTYNRAIRRACDRAGLPDHFTPNQLRHAAATRIRERFGLDGSQVILGHKHAKITEIYAEANHALARKIMAEVG